MYWIFLLFAPFFIYAEEVEQVTQNLDLYQKQFIHTLIFMLVILAAAVVIIVLMRRFFKDRFFQMNHKRNIKVLERRQISPHTHLYHIEVGTKQFILSESKYETRFITSLDWDNSSSS